MTVMFTGANLRRHGSLPETVPGNVKPLRDNHPALREKRTLFPTTVWDVKDSPRLFIHGRNNRKVGGQVQKGEWAGMPIYMLSLEERATCPTHCAPWKLCYGNAMHLARRHAHGPELERRMVEDVRALAREHPKGFVIRLHVLGDFYSAHYAAKWLCLLFEVPQLHIFGYTARTPKQDPMIFKVIERMNLQYKDRCFIRQSGPVPAPGGAVVIYENEPIEGAIICPAELIKTECCSTCGLCWAPAARDKAIAFILHGNPYRKGFTNKPRIETKGTPMQDAISLLVTEIQKREGMAVAFRKQAQVLDDEVKEINTALRVLRKFEEAPEEKTVVDYPVMTPEQVAEFWREGGTIVAGAETVADESVTAPEAETPSQTAPRPRETAIEPVSQKPHHETQKELRNRLVDEGKIKPASQQSTDLRKQPWTPERKAAASLAHRERQGVVTKGACPLKIKSNSLFHAGIYLDELDQDEKFIMVDLINDFGFEVLRSMMRGTIKDLDKVVGKLRTVIPRSLEIIDTATGWKLQAKEG